MWIIIVLSLWKTRIISEESFHCDIIHDQNLGTAWRKVYKNILFMCVVLRAEAILIIWYWEGTLSDENDVVLIGEIE